MFVVQFLECFEGRFRHSDVGVSLSAFTMVHRSLIRRDPRAVRRLRA